MLIRLGYSERTACRVSNLNWSTFYYTKHHRPTDRDIRRLLLTDTISRLHARSLATYGKRRIRAVIAIEHGLIVNPKLITTIMRDLSNVATCDDQVNREFHARSANAFWLTDIAEHPTREGKVYCCCALDIYSRKVVG